MPRQHPPPASDAKDAVQSVKRALEILHILSFNASTSGMRFSDLQAQSGQSKATLHRMLKTLELEGFVERAAGSRMYFLGLEFLAMGERALNRLDIRDVTRPSLERLSSATADTVMLTIRSGLDAVCIARREGSFPVRVLTQNVGTRRPLGVGSGSLALLAALPDEEVENVLRRNCSRLAAYPRTSTDMIRKAVAETRQRGYALNRGVILSGMYGLGVPIHLGKQLIGAISVAANQNRMQIARQKEIVALLKQEVNIISRNLGRE